MTVVRVTWAWGPTPGDEQPPHDEPTTRRTPARVPSHHDHARTGILERTPDHV